MEIEIFKDVLGYEGIYQISNSGLVYSYPRCWITGRSNAIVCHEGKLLSPSISEKGYFKVHLCVNGIRKKRLVHQLVAESFLNHKPCGLKLVVDHINDIKTDNRVENLQIVTNRFNTKKTKNNNDSSKYRGVCFYKPLQNWQSSIHINGKTVFLGRFTDEYEAHLAYVKALNQIILKQSE
jgi:hypothetical protein